MITVEQLEEATVILDNIAYLEQLEKTHAIKITPDGGFENLGNKDYWIDCRHDLSIEPQILTEIQAAIKKYKDYEIKRLAELGVSYNAQSEQTHDH